MIGLKALPTMFIYLLSVSGLALAAPNPLNSHVERTISEEGSTLLNPLTNRLATKCLSTCQPLYTALESTLSLDNICTDTVVAKVGPCYDCEVAAGAVPQATLQSAFQSFSNECAAARLAVEALTVAANAAASAVGNDVGNEVGNALTGGGHHISPGLGIFGLLAAGLVSMSSGVL
ncbi:hypothetical protein DFH07DRAFT_999005 [Mycena maculata]|uniref:Uncharacterized protein n=1 Tax=Mycena maculata TaxID=230809 RepID=A0AAD7MR59_9AGAR|nr:hypothetical protein DFH07DRAFT_999005 [Mycena maculata]